MTNKIQNNITINLNQESLLSSIIKDLWSLGIVLFAFWFNYNFIGGSYLVNALIIGMILCYSIYIVSQFERYGCKDGSWYFGVSEEKIAKIKQILDKK